MTYLRILRVRSSLVCIAREDVADFRGPVTSRIEDDIENVIISSNVKEANVAWLQSQEAKAQQWRTSTIDNIHGCGE